MCEQLEFDFDSGTEDGYRNWQQERIIKIREISNEWSVPIGRDVEIKLKSIPTLLKGHLILLAMPGRMDHKAENLHLRLNYDFKDFSLDSGECRNIEFSSDEIETWHLR